MIPLKQSTTVTVKAGPMVDATNGDTEEAELTIQKAHVRLSKNGGDIAAAHANQGASNVGAPYDETGCYDISFDATDTNTLGRLNMVIHVTGARPFLENYVVLKADLFDALITNGVFTSANFDSSVFANVGIVI